MYLFMNHIAAIIVLVVMTSLSNAQVLNTSFLNIDSSQHKNNNLNVSKLLTCEYIKNHLERRNDYRIKLRRTPNLIQVHYKVFFINIDNHNDITRDNIISFNAMIGKNINSVKTKWIYVDNYSVSIDYKFHIKNKLAVSLSLLLSFDA